MHPESPSNLEIKLGGSGAQGQSLLCIELDINLIYVTVSQIYNKYENQRLLTNWI